MKEYDSKPTFTSTDTVSYDEGESKSKGLEITTTTSTYNTNLADAIRKLDIYVLPYCCLLYLICYIDRVNLGYAKVYGMLSTLNIPESYFGIVILTFYIFYCLFEVPSNLILKKVTASRWLSLLMFCWGLVTIGNTYVKDLGHLVLCRCLVGIFEAGLFPGLIYYLSYFYDSSNLGLRLSFLIATSSLANAFSGILAYGITSIDWDGYHTWQLLFLIEGIPPLFLAIFTWFYLPNTPNRFKMLTEDEREALNTSLINNKTDSEDTKFDMAELKATFLDPKLYFYMIIYFFIAFPLISQTYLLPTIVLQLDLHLDKATTILLSAPPFLLSFLLTLINGKLSDIFKDRGYFLILPLSVASLGYVIQLSVDNPIGKYIAISLVNGFGTCAVSIILAWSSSNFKGTTANALATSITVTFGNLGGAVSGFLYQPDDAPNFTFSNAICLGSMLIAISLALILKFVILPYQNRKLEAAEKDGELDLPVEKFRFSY